MRQLQIDDEVLVCYGRKKGEVGKIVAIKDGECCVSFTTFQEPYYADQYWLSIDLVDYFGDETI